MHSSSASDLSHWRFVRAFTLALLAVWFAVTFGVTFFARDLGFLFFGWPFSYWVAAQGALIVFVLLIGVYAWVMNRIDAAAPPRSPQAD